MNLEELQIKVSIELKDLEKQLKSITKSIDKTLGPKATEKLMKDNHRIIKRESLAINKTLNKAFDVDYKSFNNNLNAAMNQAKLTVRSACNDIRRELNNALNVKANIRVTGKTSITGSATGKSSDSTAASSMASSQYIGAMIIKATNAIIANNNTNTAKLESSLKECTNKIVSAINKLSSKPKEEQNNKEKRVHNPYKKHPSSTSKVDSGIFSTKPFDVLADEIAEVNKSFEKTNETLKKTEDIISRQIDKFKKLKDVAKDTAKKIKEAMKSTHKEESSTDSTGFELGEAGGQIFTITKETKNAIKFINILKRNFNNLNLKQLGTGSYGENPLVGGSVNFKLGEEGSQTLRGKVITPQIVDLPTEQLKKTKEIIEDATYRVLEFEKALMNTSNFDLGKGFLDTSQVDAMINAFEYMKELRKQIKMPLLEAPKTQTNEEKVADIIKQTGPLKTLRELLEDINKRIAEINDSFDTTLSELSSIDNVALEQMLGSLKDWVEPIEEALSSLKELDKQRAVLKIDTSEAKKNIETLTTSYEMLLEACKTNNINKVRILLPQEEPQQTKQTKGPAKPPRMKKASGGGLEEYTSKVENLSSKLDGVADDLMDVTRILDSIDDVVSDNGINDLEQCEEVLRRLSQTDLSHLKRDIKALAESFSGSNFDTSDIKKLQDRLTALLQVRSKLSKISKDAQKGGGIDTTGLETQFRAIKNYKNVSFGDADGKTLNFLPYKAQLDKLVEYTRKAGSKISKALSGAFNKSRSVASKFVGKVRPALNKAFDGVKVGKLYGHVSNALNKSKGAVSKFSAKVRPLLNKAFNGIKAGNLHNKIAPALNKSLKLVSKFAAKVKPIIKKAFEIRNLAIRKTIELGLKGVKKALSKFASSSKSLWGKITNIFKKSAKDCGKSISPLKSSLSSFIGSLASMFGLYQLGSIFVDGTKQAIKYEAALMTIQRTLGGASKSLIDFANTNAQAFGISKSQVMEFGNIYSVIVSNFEKDATKAADTTQKLLESAGIIAGATGYSVNDVLENLRSGILGSSEAVDQLGLNLKVASLEASNSFKQIANGAKSWDDLTESQKQAIIAQEIINQTTAKYGGIVKNTSSMHNAFMAQVNNTKLALGQLGKALYTAILPALTTIMAVLEKVFSFAAQAVTSLLSLFGITVDFSSNVQGVDTSIGDSVGDSLDDATNSANEATEAVEEFKGSLAGFDEINILSDNTSKNDGNNTDTPSVDGGQVGVPEVTEGNSPFDKIADKMKEFMDKVLEPFKAAWDLLGDRWKAAWADLVDSFKNYCDSLATFLKSVWDNGGKEFVQHLAEIGLAVGIAAMEIGGTILDALTKLWQHLDPSKNMNTQGLLDALNEVSVKIRDFILGLNEHFESLMDNGGQDVLNALGDYFMNFGEAVVRSVGIVIDAWDGLIDHLDPANNEITRSMLKAWEEAFKAVGDATLSAVDFVESVMDNGGQEIYNSIGDLVMKLGEALGVFAEEIAKTWSELMEHMDPSTNPRTKKMLESIDGFVDSLTGLVDSLIKSFKNFMDNGGREFVKNLGDIAAIIIDLAATLGGDIIDVVKAFMDSWAGQALIEGAAKALEWVTDKLLGLEDAIEVVKDIFQNIKDAIIGLFEGDGEKVGESFAKFIKNVFKLRGEITEWLIDVGVDLVKFIIEGIKQAPKILWETVKFLYDVLKGFFKEFFGEVNLPTFSDFGASIMIAFSAGIEITITKITDIFDKVKEAVLGPIEYIVEKASELWSNMTESVEEKFGDIKDTFSEVCENIFGTVQEKFGKISETISTTVGEWVETTREKWTEISDTISERLSIAVSNASEKFEELKEELSDILDDFIERNKERWERIKEETSKKIEPIADEVIGKYTEMKDTTCEILDEWMKLSEEAWGQLKEKIMEKLEPLVSAVTTAYENMKESCLEIWEEVSSYLLDVWNRTKDACIDVWEEVETACIESWNRVKEECEEIWGNVSEYLTDVWNKTKESCIEIWNETVEFFSGVWDSIKNTCEEYWNNISEYLTDVWSKTKESCIEIWDGTVEFFSNTWSSIEETCKEYWDSVSEYLSDVWSKTKEKCSEIWDGTVEYFTEIWNATEEACKKAWDSTSEYLIDVWSKTKEKCSEIWDGTTEFFSDTWNSIEKTCKEYWNNISDYLSDVWTKTKENCTEIWDGVAEFFSGVWDKVEEVFGDKWDAIRDTCIDIWTDIKENCTDIWNKTKDTCIDVWTEVKENCTDIWNKTKDICGEVWGDIKDVVTEKMSGITEFFTDLWEDIKDIFGSMADDVSQFIGPKWDGVVDFFSGLGTKIYEAICGALLILPAMLKDLFGIDIFDSIKQGLEEGLDKLTNAKGLAEKAYSIGRFLIEGLCDGIKTTIKAMGTFVEGMCDIVVGFFKDLFGIHSPSTVFAELGVNLIEGLVQGIEDTISAVLDTLTELKDKVLESINKMVEKAKEKYEELKNNISEKLTKAKEITVEKWDEIKNYTVEKCTDIYEKAKEKYEEIRTTVSDKLQKIKEDSSEKWNNIKEDASTKITKLKEDAETKYNKMKETLTTTMENWRQNSEEKWSKIKSKTEELTENLKTNVEEKYNKFKTNLTTTLESWRTTSEEKWNKVKEKTTTLVNDLKTTAEEKYNTLKSNLTTTMENWRSTSEEKWNKVKEKTGSLVEDIRTSAETTYSTLKTNLGNKIQEIKSDAETKWNEVKTKTTSKVSEVVNDATTKYGELKGNFTKKMDEVKTALGPKWEELKSNAKTSAEDMVQKAKDGLKSLPETMADKMEDALESMKKKIKNVGNIFSSIGDAWKLPKIKVDGEWSLNPLKVPKFSLQWNARGGIIDGMTPLGFANGALQMGGEAGKEMVVPLENTSFTSKIAQAMGQAVDNAMTRNMNNYGVSANNNNDSKDIVLKVNERELARASINSINKLQRESGRTLLDI